LSLSLHLGKLDSLPACLCKRRLPRLLPTYTFSLALDVPPYHPPGQLSPHLSGLSPSAELSDSGLTVTAHGSSIESLAGRAPYNVEGHDTLGARSTREQGPVYLHGNGYDKPPSLPAGF
jgi:hypothetical protein